MPNFTSSANASQSRSLLTILTCQTNVYWLREWYLGNDPGFCRKSIHHGTSRQSCLLWKLQEQKVEKPYRICKITLLVCFHYFALQMDKNVSSMTETESDEDMECDSRFSFILKSIQAGDLETVFLHIRMLINLGEEGFTVRWLERISDSCKWRATVNSCNWMDGLR